MYYDQFNIDKDYTSESLYIHSLIQDSFPDAIRILNIGCGTGSHDIELAKLNYDVVGLDTSSEMIKIAKQKKSIKNLDFLVDLKNTYTSRNKFDVVTSLFHVISYQTNKLELDKIFSTASRNLKKGGIFIFDYWYSPAVAAIKPEIRHKIITVDGMKIIRESIPYFISENLYQIELKIKSEQHTFTEIHLMRSFTPADFFDQKDFKNTKNYSWMTKDNLSNSSFSAISVFEKI
jgi:SAM-dependent methyltransferase